jgi:hypothetical protein
MRFNTDFIDFVRRNIYEPGSRGDGILLSVVQHRRQTGLDSKFTAADPWSVPDKTLEYEIRKLGTIFGVLNSHRPCATPGDVVEILKETYPAAEVDEIVSEYFPDLV